MEQGQPIGAWHQGVGEGERGRFELERLGELGAEEQRTLEVEVVQGRVQGVAHRRHFGVAARAAGVLVMGFPSPRPDDRD